LNYKEYLKTLIGRRGTLCRSENNVHYSLRFNEPNVRMRNAHLLKVQDDFVIIHHDIHGVIKIPLSSLW